MSIPPSSSTASATKRSQLSGSVTSSASATSASMRLDAARPAGDADALGAQRTHGRGADPARRAGDDRRLSLELHRASLISPGACSTWRVVCVSSKRSRRSALQLSPDRVAVGPGRTSTCADSAGKPDVIVQTCRSWTPTTPSTMPSPRRPRARPSPPASPRAARRPSRGARRRCSRRRAADQRSPRSGRRTPTRSRARRARDDDAGRRDKIGEHVQLAARTFRPEPAP